MFLHVFFTINWKSIFFYIIKSISSVTISIQIKDFLYVIRNPFVKYTNSQIHVLNFSNLSVGLIYCGVKVGNVVLWLCCKGKRYEAWLFMYCDRYEASNYCAADVSKWSINALCCKSWRYDVLLYCAVEVEILRFDVLCWKTWRYDVSLYCVVEVGYMMCRCIVL